MDPKFPQAEGTPLRQLQHKRRYDDFINPKYENLEEKDGERVAEMFQEFVDSMMEYIPDENPKDGYSYSAYMTQFQVTMTVAKELFSKARNASRLTKKKPRVE